MIKDYLKPSLAVILTVMPLSELPEPFYDEHHRCKLWITGDADGPPPLVLRSERLYWQPDARYIPILWDTSLLPFARLLSVGRIFTLDGSLISSLVDRRRPETHTFYFGGER